MPDKFNATTERTRMKRSFGARYDLEAVLSIAPRPMTARQLLRAGIGDLADMLDDGELSVELAALVAMFAPDDQRSIIDVMQPMTHAERVRLVELLIQREAR